MPNLDTYNDENKGYSWKGIETSHPFHFSNIDKFRRASIEDPFSNEPTYLTFGIDIDTATDIKDNPTSGLDRVTGLPSNPLFHHSTLNSAYQYLRARNYDYRASCLLEFTNIIHTITKEYPWFLESISGVKELWKGNTDISKAFAFGDTKIQFETMESLNLNVTRMANLYREFAYDKVYRREIIPDNLLWFNMNIVISEARNLYISPSDYTIDEYNYFDKYNNYLLFKCSMCTFDFTESIPVDRLSSSISGRQSNPERNKFAVKIGKVEEGHSFGFSNAYIGTQNQSRNNNSSVIIDEPANDIVL